MFSAPYFGNSLVAANMLINAAEASRVVASKGFSFCCLLYSWHKFFKSRAPCDEMKAESGLIDEQPRSSGSSSKITFKVGPESTKTTCPQCKCIINTRVTNESSMQTHIVAVMLFPACCCIPYYFSCCKNVHHYCPSCNQYIETFRR